MSEFIKTKGELVPDRTYLFTIGTQNHALMYQLLKWLWVFSVPKIIQDLMPKSCIQQVENGVLGATNVQIDWHPIFI